MNRAAAASATPAPTVTRITLSPESVLGSQTSSPRSNASPSAASLNDAQLNTPIPIFGLNQLQIRDFVNVPPSPATLNRIRSELRDFMMLKLSLTSNPTDENVTLVNSIQI